MQAAGLIRDGDFPERVHAQTDYDKARAALALKGVDYLACASR